ncbi:MAG: Site-specific recombinase [Cypionkella sp.]|uniref:recombinase family protein n=1 Tax=Cypionkella sp. TaxID=2811411 RepID=UPI002622E5A9|nr:recombinase family protein [Cypionkella sp.]MDB5658230.1 Site-specific recombinase [Cypionkella sp.]
MENRLTSGCGHFRGAGHGVSAYTGNNPGKKSALGQFRAAAESGKFQAGPVLLVESLDRLSREAEIPAMHLSISIVMAGVDVVTLSNKQVYSAKAGLTVVMYALMDTSRANN